MAASDNNGSWKNTVIAILIAAFVGYWGGQAIANFQSKATMDDHEDRIRKVEEAVIYLKTLVEERNAAK